ncbi:MAG: hypothetical protein JWP69_1469 [Flaviaesturariibacter sp.]|nr:hypothetical protein [Flaviaesturariibacter sp.]
MRITKGWCAGLTVVVPLLTGASLYLLPPSSSPVLRNHLADGLWAFAFLSTILIIWDYRLPPVWKVAALALPAAFEGLQLLQLVSGTPDWMDIITYFLFFGLALLTHALFLTALPPKHNYEKEQKPNVVARLCCLFSHGYRQ